MKEHFRSIGTLAVLCGLSAIYSILPSSMAQAGAASASFNSARPIWPVGRQTEKNLFVGFRAVFECSQQDEPVLRIAASSLYRIYLNGRFVGHGPARGPHGFYRVDEWSLDVRVGAKNILAIEVAGYNVNSYYLLNEPAFVRAEVVSGGRVLASTAGKGVDFQAVILKHRVQKVQRYNGYINWEGSL